MSGALIRWSGTRPLLPAIALFLFCLVWLATAGSANEPPSIVISGPSTYFYPPGVQPLPINFTVTDKETPAEDLRIYIETSDSSVIAPTNLTLMGSGTNRSLLVKPTPNRDGHTILELTVIDPQGGHQSTRITFLASLSVYDSAPIITGISDQTIWENTPTLTLQFEVADQVTLPEKISATAHSLNTNLITDTAITLAGSGREHTITLHPTTGRTGTCIVELLISDPDGNTLDYRFLVHRPSEYPHQSTHCGTREAGKLRLGATYRAFHERHL